ncbi:RRQRL motif-containing zinc-binding protein [Streptomyces flavidovirens]|uniref:RRQRL motif-containing zinc-binding protein n=1 Tax=Streptomyces flavidovirens TaxID=67298 RepID=UPI0004045C45|nr:RRQRL motif-containing zinc-binding protein [Streptomyces flavidovirens]
MPGRRDLYDPTGERHGIPTFPWKLAPEGYATYRQLRAAGLRPGGQPVAAQLLRPRRRRGPLTAYLYRIDRALPVRPMTPARRAALAKANAAQQICPNCRCDVGYRIPRSHGMCGTCIHHEEQRAA